MPYAIVLEAVASRPQVRMIHGFQMQSGFLNLIERVQPELSRELHDKNVLRQYGLALMEPGLGQVVRSGVASVRVRVACLDDRIYPALLQLALNPVTAAIRLGNTDFKLTRLTVTDDRAQAWTGFAPLEELLENNDFDRSPFLNFEFATPTVFRQGERDDPLPLPEHVFGSLAQRLSNVYSGFPFPDNKEFREAVREQVTVTRLSGETETAEIGDGLKLTGFVGRVTYRTHDGEAARWCRRLARLAFFCGIGAKTSRGMGCARCKD